MLESCAYRHIDDEGLHITVNGEERILRVDPIVICAGQKSERELTYGLAKPHHLIGGADRAVELNAKRAIDQGMRLGAMIRNFREQDCI